MTELQSLREPPKHWWQALRCIGPGLILSASVVGSGELIATTTLGARAGFGLLWIILLGCLVKIAVQLEFGRFAVSHGMTTLQGWELQRGGRIGRLHWTTWCAFLYLVAMIPGQAGVMGAAAQVLTFAVPALPTFVAVGVVALSISMVQSSGGYAPVEKGAVFLNALFVTSVLLCVIAVQYSPFAFRCDDLALGFRFHLPPETLGLALAAFGITGIAAGEVAMYPYWLLEKGYARFCGPPEDSAAWASRARGWIRVMTVDAVASAVVYTTTTCAFYLLGASVLRNQSTVADGNALILQLSSLFTSTLGMGTRAIFMLGAFAVLYSTVFANTGAYSRWWADLAAVWRRLRSGDERFRRLVVRWVIWLFPWMTGGVYLFLQRPLFLIVLMGLANTLFLIVVAYQAVVFRYRWTDRRLRPGRLYDVALWLSLAAMALVALRSVGSLLR